MHTNPKSPAGLTYHLDRPDGRVSYQVEGDGPLVVLVPGVGELRSAYRFVAPMLRGAGFRVAATDLRGQGDSDTTFSSYGDVDTAQDISALIEELGGPAIIVGNSLAGGAAVLVAADHADQVTGLVLVGPYVRNPPTSLMTRALLRVLMAPAWAATSWKSYMPKLYAGHKPADFDQYRASVVANLRRPGHAKAFSRTIRTDHAPAEARLGDVTAPVMVIMGELDPDWKNPAGEAEWIGSTLHGEVVMVPDAGHYPQSQQPKITGEAVLRFAAAVTNRA